MTAVIIFILSLLVLAALFAMAVVVRDIGRELDGLGNEDKKTLKKIEKWRDGK